KGVGDKTQELFHNLGVYTIGDILLHYPRNYKKLPPIIPLCELPEYIKSNTLEDAKPCIVAVAAQVNTVPCVRAGNKMQVTSLLLHDVDVRLDLVWFRMPYLRTTLTKGEWFVFLGTTVYKGRIWHMEQPQIFLPEKYSGMQESLWPSYPLTSGLSKNKISHTIKQVLEQLDLSRDYLTEEIRGRNELAEYNFAIKNIHFPESETALNQARKRLIFDEFFQFILAAGMQKEQMEELQNDFSILPLNGDQTLWTEQLITQLPYSLTTAQLRTLQEIREGLRKKKVMQRLVQGDVGSGKTIVAFLSMVDVAQSGYQSALMAPTEVLAAQHYQTFLSLCKEYELKIPIILLTGSFTAKEKRRAYERMELYPNAIIIGTHALIQERAIFDHLALVITDEQHRFGVKQRETLSLKGSKPHVLVMSATPIPRTLAIILYGDLDISVIDEVPAQRLPIKNCVVGKNARKKSYDFLEKEIQLGHQGYVICPLVEESEGLEAENVTSYCTLLQNIFPKQIVVAYIHGKMKSGIKNLIMEQFSKNEIQILVSTTVIEVGVDVPNATVMIIEDAQRFGLAQLHQLRGRVGRGAAQSYCIMINTSNGEKAKKRLEILNQSGDGFFIAGEDLKLRGPGDFFGIRQSGILEFSLGDIYQNADLLKEASKEASIVLAEDRQLEMPQHSALREQMQNYLQRQAELVNL
ncbi:MAG: ATP-dependent DNA helicase RecG, partial [Lachnospiraceae bacterium]